jgi:hypothetical protein
MYSYLNALVAEQHHTDLLTTAENHRRNRPARNELALPAGTRRYRGRLFVKRVPAAQS